MATSPHLVDSQASTTGEAMETSTVEPSRKTLWGWHFGLASIVLFLFAAVPLCRPNSALNDEYIFEAPLDYDSSVPNIIDALPQCIHSCLIPRITNLGCAHSDYTCFCRNFHLLDNDNCVLTIDGEISFETCARQCDGHQGLDLAHSPWLILDLCKAVDEPVTLPSFMTGMMRLYGRQDGSSSASFPESPTPTPTVTETLPWGENPSSFPAESFDGSRFIVFASDTTISTFFSTTTLAPGAAAFTSAVTAQNSPAVTEIIGVTQKATSTTTSSSTSTNTTSPSHGGLSSGAKAGIGVGVAIAVILFAVGLGWFIIVHRRKRRRATPAEIQREKNDGGLPEPISTIDELALDSISPGKYSRSPGGTLPQEVAGSQVQVAPNELPASGSAVQRHELQETSPATQSTDPETGAKTQIPGSSERGQQSNIQRKAVSPGPSSFPPPWATSPQQGDDERLEQSGVGQLQEETKNTASDEMVVEPDEHDPELLRLEEEMAKVKVERERLQRLQDLELREEELKKTIEERRKGAGG